MYACSILAGSLEFKWFVNSIVWRICRTSTTRAHYKFIKHLMIIYRGPALVYFNYFLTSIAIIGFSGFPLSGFCSSTPVVAARCDDKCEIFTSTATINNSFRARLLSLDLWNCMFTLAMKVEVIKVSSSFLESRLTTGTKIFTVLLKIRISSENAFDVHGFER